MAATGLDVFDKTLQTTNIWLDEIMDVIGPDRQVAWHALGAVLRTLRDRLPLGLAAHLGSQLPLLVRGSALGCSLRTSGRSTCKMGLVPSFTCSRDISTGARP